MSSRFAQGLVLTACLLVPFSIAVRAEDDETDHPTVKERIAELSAEKADLLRERYELRKRDFDIGEAGIEQVLVYEHEYLKAKLASVAEKKEQNATHQMIVKNRKRMVELREVSFHSGIGSKEAWLKSRADLLTARINQLDELPEHATIKASQ